MANMTVKPAVYALLLATIGLVGMADVHGVAQE